MTNIISFFFIFLFCEMCEIWGTWHVPDRFHTSVCSGGGTAHSLCCICIVWRAVVAGCRPWWGYNDSNVSVSGRPLCLTPRLISPRFRTAAPAVLCASASAPSSTASWWLPGQRLTCQSEASLKPWSPCAERKPQTKYIYIYITALNLLANCSVKN